MDNIHPMTDEEMQGRYVCVARGGCLHSPHITITSNGVWVRYPDSMNPGSTVSSSAHRDCYYNGLSWEDMFNLPRQPLPLDLVAEWMSYGNRNMWIKTSWDPPFNEKSIRVVESRAEMRKWLEYGNWANGTGFAVKEKDMWLCFVQQGECTDEWVCMKHWPDGQSLAFESISWRYIITRKPEEYNPMMDRLFAATYDQARTLDY